MKNINVLIIDDEIRITDELKEFLERKKYTVYAANKPSEGFFYLEKHKIDLVLLDLKLPEMSGIEVLNKIKEINKNVEVIMITGHGDMDTVIEAMRHGATDFLRKPFNQMDVIVAIERIEKFLNLSHEINIIKNQKSLIDIELEKKIERNLIGKSKAIKNCLELALEAAKYPDVNVFIHGESGTGKEIIARIIHYASSRKDMSFFPVNCNAIPESLMESEFFGHRKGSFTGAFENKKGFFEMTEKGTLFLDEIADMSQILQAKLLRVLEDRKIKRIGESFFFDIDVRIVAATNQNIEDLISQGKFRLDLYHRFNTFQIEIPPLRKRKEDIEPIFNYYVEYFSKKFNKPINIIDEEIIPELKNYRFPGNVRELRNMIERAIILSKNGELVIDNFNIKTQSKKKSEKIKVKTLHENEKDIVLKALENNNYNQTKAAESLGISRHAFIRRIKKYEIDI